MSAKYCLPDAFGQTGPLSVHRPKETCIGLHHHARRKQLHGFLKGRSTCTNLMECMNDWTLFIQYKRLVTVVYIDFSKAFDVVSHDKLLIRLAAYGITGTLLK